MNAIEKYEIYDASKLPADQQYNDKFASKSALLYNATMDIDARRQPLAAGWCALDCAVIVSVIRVRAAFLKK